jgi:hypothetical protein
MLETGFALGPSANAAATSFVDIQTEAQFDAKLADIKRRVPSKRNGLEARGVGESGDNPLALDWRASRN